MHLHIKSNVYSIKKFLSTLIFFSCKCTRTKIFNLLETFNFYFIINKLNDIQCLILYSCIICLFFSCCRPIYKKAWHYYNLVIMVMLWLLLLRGWLRNPPIVTCYHHSLILLFNLLWKVITVSYLFACFENFNLYFVNYAIELANLFLATIIYISLSSKILG